MLTMAVGQSDDVDPLAAVAAAIKQCRVQLAGQTPQAGILFVADDFDAAVPAIVRAEFPGIQLIGATSAAQIASTGGYTEDGVTLTVFAYDTVEMTGAVADHIETETDTRALLPEETVLVGRAAAGNGPDVRPNFEFHNDVVAENGPAVVPFSEPLQLSVALGTGLRPIGPRGIVTKSAYGQISEIDKRPAGEFVRGYVTEPGPASFGNPLGVRQSASETWYLCAMLGSDPLDGSLSIAGAVPEGAEAQLTTASMDEIVSAVGDVARDAVDRFPAEVTPAGALIFSYSIRKFMLGSRTAEELAQARTALDERIPVAGMYCTSEIAPTRGQTQSRYHNETIVTLLLGA